MLTRKDLGDAETVGVSTADRILFNITSHPQATVAGEARFKIGRPEMVRLPHPVFSSRRHLFEFAF